MRFGIKKLRLEIEVSRHYFRAKIPLRFKLTFYIGIVALICMTILAAACIILALGYTQRLMRERLSQFASMSAQQIERDMNNQATRLNNAVQGDSITVALESLYNGTVTADDWASSMESLVRYLFSTSLQSYQGIYIYDTSATLLFSLANPELSSETVKQLRLAVPRLLPLGSKINGENQTQLPSNRSAATIQASIAAVDASLSGTETIAGQIGSNGVTNSIPNSNVNTTIKQNSALLDFKMNPDGVPSWISKPVPLVDSSGKIDTYSVSFTVPVTRLTITDSVQISRLVGYSTAIIDCSQYVSLGNNPAYNNSLIVQEMRGPVFAVVDADEQHGWKYLFPEGKNTTNRNTSWHHFDEFPAVAASIQLRDRFRNSSDNHKPGGVLMKTRAPKVSLASVGYSFANVLNQEWFITLALPESQVEYGYRHQTYIFLCVAIIILMFIFSAAFLLTGLTTNPVLHIYRGMVLGPHQRRAPNGKPNTKSKDIFGEIVPVGSNQSGLTAVANFDSVKQTKDEEVMAWGANGEEYADCEDEPEESTLNSPVPSEPSYHIDEDETFRIPQPLEPLNRRWIFDEFDELIAEYNTMIDLLSTQYMKMEDEVKVRTREARESQRIAEEANASKSYFLMNVQNDMRTPMHAILGLAAVAYEETDLNIIRASLYTIINSSNILKDIFQELLEYATHIRGEEEKVYSLSTLASNVQSTFACRAEKRGIQFSVHIHTSMSQTSGSDIVFFGGQRSFINNELTGTADTSSMCFVENDFGRTLHICTSLVSNAVKFTDPEKVPNVKGKVDVHISVTKPDGQVDVPANWGPKAAMLEIMVADNGIGITKERMAHIFQTFIPADAALSTRISGRGLGLAMSKLLCERLGGYVVAYTRPNVGSTVVCRLPVQNVNDQPLLTPGAPPVESTPVFVTPKGGRAVWKTSSKRPGQVLNEILQRKSISQQLSLATLSTPDPDVQINTQSSTSPLKVLPVPSSSHSNPISPSIELERESISKLHVLVADDDTVMRQLLYKILVTLGVGHVDLATDGQTVIQKVEEAIINGTRYSIIFMDLTMPETSGIEATRDIRKQLGYICPVVALTGHSDPETFRNCARAGIQKVLVKPVMKEQLAQTISELVGIKIIDLPIP